MRIEILDELSATRKLGTSYWPRIVEWVEIGRHRLRGLAVEGQA